MLTRVLVYPEPIHRTYCCLKVKVSDLGWEVRDGSEKDDPTSNGARFHSSQCCDDQRWQLVRLNLLLHSNASTACQNGSREIRWIETQGSIATRSIGQSWIRSLNRRHPLINPRLTHESSVSIFHEHSCVVTEVSVDQIQIRCRTRTAQIFRCSIHSDTQAKPLVRRNTPWQWTMEIDCFPALVIPSSFLRSVADGQEPSWVGEHSQLFSRRRWCWWTSRRTARGERRGTLPMTSMGVDLLITSKIKLKRHSPHPYCRTSLVIATSLERYRILTIYDHRLSKWKNNPSAGLRVCFPRSCVREGASSMSRTDWEESIRHRWMSPRHRSSSPPVLCHSPRKHRKHQQTSTREMWSIVPAVPWCLKMKNQEEDSVWFVLNFNEEAMNMSSIHAYDRALCAWLNRRISAWVYVIVVVIDEEKHVGFTTSFFNHHSSRRKFTFDWGIVHRTRL